MDIFISYRRDDAGAAYAAPRVAGDLRRLLNARVFMDIDTLPPGVDFEKAIEEAVSRCSVLIAVIGKDWLNARDAGGQRRLGLPGDWVRLEVGTALARGIRVVPALLDNTAMPKEEELPDNLKPLAKRQNIELSLTTFDRDVEFLARSLGRKVGEWRRRGLVLAGMVGAALLAVAGFFKLEPKQNPPTSVEANRSLEKDTTPQVKPPRKQTTSAEINQASEEGINLVRQGKFEEGATQLQKAVMLEPRNSAAFASLGYALEQTGDYDKAVAASRRAIDLDPGDVFAHWNLGNELYALHQYEEAAASHRAALQISPSYINAYIGLGNALSKLGREAEAQEAFEMARDPSKRP